MLFDTAELNNTELDIMEKIFKAGGFPHRMPKNGVMSKTVERSIEMVRQLSDGSYLTKWGLDRDWLASHGMTREWLSRPITHSFEKTAQIVTESVMICRESRDDTSMFPRDKRSLPTDFPSFMCNPMNGKSWFLYFLMYGKQTLRESNLCTWLEKLPKSFLSATQELGLRWDSALPNIAENVVYLQRWYKEKRQPTFSWMSIASAKDFWLSYLDYVADIVGDKLPTAGYFEVGGKTHRGWARNMGVSDAV